MKLLAGLLLAPSLASAADGTFSQSGAFSTLPGYGYVVEGRYQSTLGAMSFEVLKVDGYKANDPLMLGTRLAIGFRLQPADVAPTMTDGDLTVSLRASIVNLATGMPGYPAEVLTPGGSGYQLVQISGAGFTSNYVTTLLPEAQRISDSVLTETKTVSDQNGALPFGHSSWGCYASSPVCPGAETAPAWIQLDYALHFEAGRYLTPSADPACVGAACLVEARDALVIREQYAGVGVSTVPEPATYGLLMSGLLTVGLVLRRRRLTSGQPAAC
jgi:hypothetical protein